MNHNSRLFNHCQQNSTGSEAKKMASSTPVTRDLWVERRVNDIKGYDDSNTTALHNQAAKYRAMAAQIGAHVTGPYNRDYYLAKADDLEQQARAMPAAEIKPAAEPEPPPPPEPVATKPPRPAPTAPPKQIKTHKEIMIHSYLAAAVVGDKRPNVHRAYSVWASVDRSDRTHFRFADVLDYFSRKTTTDPRTVRRWIESGNGIFWNLDDVSGDTIVRFYGKYQVFAHYKLSIPGRTLRVETARLLGELKILRATLFACFNTRQSKWIARETLTRITGVHERTQRNYDKLNRQKKRKVFASDHHLETSDSDMRQLPNIYYPIFYPKDYGIKGDARQGLYTPEEHGLKTGVTVSKQRTLFDNARSGIETAKKRHRQGKVGCIFIQADESKQGSMLVRPVYYQQA